MPAMIDGPRLPPRGGAKPDHLVILSHGYGADGNDLIGLAPHWQPLLPGAYFVAPNAPEPCEMSPMGYQWFAIGGSDPVERAKGVADAAPVLDMFIDQELDRLGLDESRLALVGFSQGTMMSLHVGLRRSRAPAAIVGFSGALAGADTLGEEIRVRPPVMMIHGDADDMLPVSRMHAAVQALGEAEVPVQWHVCRGLGHAIDGDGLRIAGRFIADGFAGRLAARVAAQ